VAGAGRGRGRAGIGTRDTARRTRRPIHSHRLSGRNTASPTIIAAENSGRPIMTAIEMCMPSSSTRLGYFNHLLNTAKGKATCTNTVR